MKALIIADDFTGANDTGMQLAKKGARTEVVMNRSVRASPRTDVLVLNTESRGLNAQDARRQVVQAMQSVAAQIALTSLILYKKIDSTLRGNLGAEIDAAMQIGNRRMAIVAPAIPSVGRTTENGECCVYGIPLLQTEFASDPKTPVLSSRIKTLIEAQSNCPVSEVGLLQVQSGHLSKHLQQLIPARGECIVVCDARTYDDLATIAKAALSLSVAPLLVGAAGLADALPPSRYCTQSVLLPVLVVAGSMSEATWHQVEQVRQAHRAEVVDVDVRSLLGVDNGRQLSVLVDDSCRILSAGKHCILRTCRTLEERNNIHSLCQEFHLSLRELGETLSHILGALTLRIVDGTKVGALFLTGGDIATSVAQALGATGYRIQGEVAPCIPWGTFINSEIEDLPVITKAGGFGTDNTLQNALEFIEEMYSE